ncbi:dual specificity protein phosphatase [Baffinella frigidus]|nr:dual specificity protein phosphatase [Cryptophyta sp. CCMP2293]
MAAPENLHQNLPEAATGTVEWTVGEVYPVVPGRLCFAVHRDEHHTAQAIRDRPGLFYFSTCDHENYIKYCHDFGPTDLAGVVSFCRRLRSLMNDPRLNNRPVVYYSDMHQGGGVGAEFRTNAAFLLGAYLILEQGYTPEEAFAPFSRIGPSPFLSFRDASFLESDFDLSILDCLKGLARGFHEGWLDVDSFDVDRYHAVP